MRTGAAAVALVSVSALTALAQLGPGSTSPSLAILAGAIEAAIGVLAWMRIARRTWEEVAEMSAALASPVVGLLLARSLGLVTTDAVLRWVGPTMVAMMVLLVLSRARATSGGPGSAERGEPPAGAIGGPRGL